MEDEKEKGREIYLRNKGILGTTAQEGTPEGKRLIPPEDVVV